VRSTEHSEPATIAAAPTMFYKISAVFAAHRPKKKPDTYAPGLLKRNVDLFTGLGEL
jgi:hypothetical protein